MVKRLLERWLDCEWATRGEAELKKWVVSAWPGGHIRTLAPFCGSYCPLFPMPQAGHLTSISSFCCDITDLEPAAYGLEPWAKITLSSCEFWASGILSQGQESQHPLKLTSPHRSSQTPRSHQFLGPFFLVCSSCGSSLLSVLISSKIMCSPSSDHPGNTPAL